MHAPSSYSFLHGGHQTGSTVLEMERREGQIKQEEQRTKWRKIREETAKRKQLFEQKKRLLDAEERQRRQTALYCRRQEQKHHITAAAEAIRKHSVRAWERVRDLHIPPTRPDDVEEFLHESSDHSQPFTKIDESKLPPRIKSLSPQQVNIKQYDFNRRHAGQKENVQTSPVYSTDAAEGSNGPALTTNNTASKGRLRNDVGARVQDKVHVPNNGAAALFQRELAEAKPISAMASSIDEYADDSDDEVLVDAGIETRETEKSRGCIGQPIAADGRFLVFEEGNPLQAVRVDWQNTAALEQSVDRFMKRQAPDSLAMQQAKYPAADRFHWSPEGNIHDSMFFGELSSPAVESHRALDAHTSPPPEMMPPKKDVGMRKLSHESAAAVKSTPPKDIHPRGRHGLWAEALASVTEGVDKHPAVNWINAETAAESPTGLLYKLPAKSSTLLPAVQALTTPGEANRPAGLNHAKDNGRPPLPVKLRRPSKQTRGPATETSGLAVEEDDLRRSLARIEEQLKAMRKRPIMHERQRADSTSSNSPRSVRTHRSAATLPERGESRFGSAGSRLRYIPETCSEDSRSQLSGATFASNVSHGERLRYRARSLRPLRTGPTLPNARHRKYSAYHVSETPTSM